MADFCEMDMCACFGSFFSPFIDLLIAWFGFHQS